ncbi:hypothetical protein [Reichenbachiella sp.]|uniref:hypothetical protein n=1 Tax=Reichenbachiella sp. TaxID=2184521 RepID=UPI003BAF16EA
MRFLHLYTLFLCLLGSTRAAYSQSSTISIEMDAFSHYIWRDDINDFIVFQPSIDYRFPRSNAEHRQPGLNLNLWLSVNSDVEYGVPMESATTLYYHWITLDSMDFKAGLVHYSGHDSTMMFFDLPIHNWMELYAGFAAPQLFLSPEVEIYYHDMTGAYPTLGLSYGCRIGKVPFEVSFLTGFRFASQNNDNGWREVDFTLGVPFHIKSFDLEVSITHSQFPGQSLHRTFIGLNISLP